MEYCRRKHSNLQSFLAHTTPSVPTYPLSKEYIRDLNSHWQPNGEETMEYFMLGDLWDQYSEWSAYGAGVPIILDNHETVLQYYVPYLSAIQIYTSKSLVSSRILLEENEGESCSDDSESEKMSKSWDASSEDSVTSQEAQDSSLTRKDVLGQIYLHYIEYDSPYRRIPLMDKVNELAQRFPGLMSSKSIDVSPASWMSVAWYPIYHIPTNRNVKDLSACFLTYHSLSASVQDSVVSDSEKDFYSAIVKTNKWETKKGSNSITLSPFGLSAYKMQGSVWRNPRTSDSELMSGLYSASESWLKQLGVRHQDFEFFATH
ncbi:hypothetical protein Cni_G01500 [Canna indica]|uniref:Plant/F9H3-4 protein n=1 Tax=Canna indica TaxID=4628 RepID=A0AAQ3JMR0_9LILI|nr:hypothetical protein Cni_G01500 [Canna indica]